MFPRIKAIRHDKGMNDIDTLNTAYCVGAFEDVTCLSLTFLR